jgi:tetratricopeptide (TPR) repeat protein
MFGDPPVSEGEEPLDSEPPSPDTLHIETVDSEEEVGALIERAAASPDRDERIRLFLEAAALYGRDLGELDKALITAQAALNEDFSRPESVEALEKLADRLGRRGQLLEEYETHLGEVQGPDQRVALLLLLAGWHDQRGEATAAESKLNRALAEDPTSMLAIRAMSKHLSDRKDWTRLAQHLTRMGAGVRRTPDRVEMLLAAADLHKTRLNETARAAELYASALDLDPSAVPALEALTDIAWQDENWIKVMPLLEQLATLPDRTPAERSRVSQRAALTALRLGEDARARAHALALVNLDGGANGVNFLSDWLDIAVARSWWDDVGVIGPWLRNLPDFQPPTVEQAELAARIGQSQLEAGQLEAAVSEYELALRLDPNHRRAREQLAEIKVELGDAAGALEHKKRLSEAVAGPEERFRLLVDIARSERDHMDNHEAALATFEEARALKPGDRSILAEMLDLYTERKQWLSASEILLTLAENEEAPTRARYLVAAANILHYELGESEQALELYDRALDDDPDDLKSFERQDKILTARRDFKEQARAYRRMIKRVGAATDDQKKVTLLLLWRGLAEILRSRLMDHTSAQAALEVCVQLDPDGQDEREALAELLEGSGPEGLRPAVEHRNVLVQKLEDGGALIRQLKALRRIYGEAGLWDRVYNVCAALVVLQGADEEERKFYDQVAGGGLAMAQAALTEEVWQKVIYDAKEERHLSLLFSCVVPVVALARSQDAKSYGLKDKRRLDPNHDPEGIARLFEFGAGVLNVLPPPSVLLNPDFVGDVEIINLREVVGAGANIMVSPSLFTGRVEKDVAFIVGRTLAMTRADHLVLSRHVVPSTVELGAIVYAAYKLCKPSATLANPASFEPYLQLFKKALPPQALEPLSSLVPWLDENWRNLDIDGWRRGAERTADRAGLLLCGDLGAAVRVIHASRGMGAAEAVIDLVRWSVSEGHLGLRELLGLTVTTAAA